MKIRFYLRVLALIYVFLGICAFAAGLIIGGSVLAVSVWEELIRPHPYVSVITVALFLWWLAFLYLDASTGAALSSPMVHEAHEFAPHDFAQGLDAARNP